MLLTWVYEDFSNKSLFENFAESVLVLAELDRKTCDPNKEDTRRLKMADSKDARRHGLGLRFDTKYNEQTGLLHAINLGLERFRPGTGKFDFETQTYDHHYERTDAKPKPDDESGWEGQQSHTIHFAESVDIGSLPPGTVVHVLFHFHDNYCDCTRGFLDRDQAELEFKKQEDQTMMEIEEAKKHREDYAFCVAKQDKWHCDLLECELTGRPYSRYINQTGGFTRPDKGDTWWLRSLVLG